MTTPFFTVVIPTRNRAALLPTAIRSALGQTFADLEVVVVDDASDDGTREQLAGMSDPRLRVLHQESRRGGAAARNAGIRASRSEWIAFLDDDDEWFPEKLEWQTAVVRAGGPDLGVVYSSYRVVHRETGRVHGRKTAEHRGDLSETILARNVVGGTSSVVARRSVLERAGLFDERLPSFQDYDLWIRLAGLATFDFVEKDALTYYVHDRKIWTDLGALRRGMEIMLEKHGASRALRHNLAAQLLGVGVRYCDRGELHEGRDSLRRAIEWNPLAARPYLNLALSFLGAPAFRAAHAARKPVVAREPAVPAGRGGAL